MGNHRGGKARRENHRNRVDLGADIVDGGKDDIAGCLIIAMAGQSHRQQHRIKYIIAIADDGADQIRNGQSQEFLEQHIGGLRLPFLRGCGLIDRFDSFAVEEIILQDACRGRYRGRDNRRIERPLALHVEHVYEHPGDAEHETDPEELFKDLREGILFHLLESLIEASEAGKHRHQENGQRDQTQQIGHDHGAFAAAARALQHDPRNRSGQDHQECHSDKAERRKNHQGKLTDGKQRLVVPFHLVSCHNRGHRQREAGRADIENVVVNAVCIAVVAHIGIRGKNG